ncbi:MAG: 6-phosphofructokinase 1 [Bacillota bacterium]|nr:6-phosphofructokinase 1 [Bacillota bacterium]MDK2924723.1 6-phosphofructokinase 1 [Bacillota bacterium]MDK2960805.1 6-phosphofructokinase 1 [Bacillota bacterium]
MRIGVLTSGGDAPGMNAAIRAVVLQAARRGVEVIGIRRGYEGLLAGEFCPLGPADVRDIIGKGGTFLKCTRSPRFRTEAGLEEAHSRLQKEGIEALVVIGGDGSFRGAARLAALGIQVVGIPGTIDNDIPGTETTIGFDTAVSVVVETIDRIKDTATSLVTAEPRVFVVEVMGRDLGAIAAYSGLASGADWTIIPEVPCDLGTMCSSIERSQYSVILVAEGAGGALAVAQEIKARVGIEPRVSILGHLQRGGVPTPADRVLATRLGVAAVDFLLTGGSGKYMGIVRGEVQAIDFPAEGVKKDTDLGLYWLAMHFASAGRPEHTLTYCLNVPA